MDTGKRIRDYQFYEGFDGEGDLIVCTETREMHIWDGYIEDIFGKAEFEDNGWHGLTRDYQENKGVFNDMGVEVEVDALEYLCDLKNRKRAKYHYEETAAVLDQMIRLFSEAHASEKSIKLMYE